MNITLKPKYRDPRGNPSTKTDHVKGGRGSNHGSNKSGVKRSKGLLHPIGYSGRTAGRMIRSFKPRDKK